MSNYVPRILLSYRRNQNPGPFYCFCAAGKLENNQIPWRGDSALTDGKEAGLDLSKGMYDAGDHMKFTFPMAFTATVLAWSVLEYGDQMSAAKQLDPALDALKWITDFLIAAHPSDNVLYIQVRVSFCLFRSLGCPLTICFTNYELYLIKNCSHPVLHPNSMGYAVCLKYGYIGA